MQALVVYESMCGTTHNVAIQIADSLRTRSDVCVNVAPVGVADA
jgi:flavodoxin